MFRDIKRWVLYRKFSFRYWAYRRPIVTVVILAGFVLVVQMILMLILNSENDQVTSQNENAYQGAKNKIGKVWKKRAKVPSQGLGRILGVLESDQSKYLPTKEHNFRCLNIDQEIDFDRLNDDYCDCTDGSDEPSTSACAALGSTFQCKYGGGKSIPSSRVNDGVCDCCQGEDEYLHLPVVLSNNKHTQSLLFDSAIFCKNLC